MSIGDNMDKVYAMAYAQRAIQRFLSFDNREECPDAGARSRRTGRSASPCADDASSPP